MLNRRVNPEVVRTNAVVLQLLDEMHTYGPNTPEYASALESLQKINDLRKLKDRPRIDPNAIIQASGALLGILVIVAYEQKHAMTSKALGFVGKTKL